MTPCASSLNGVIRMRSLQTPDRWGCMCADRGTRGVKTTIGDDMRDGKAEELPGCRYTVSMTARTVGARDATNVATLRVRKRGMVRVWTQPERSSHRLVSTEN